MPTHEQIKAAYDVLHREVGWVKHSTVLEALRAAEQVRGASEPVAWQVRQYIREINRWGSWETSHSKPNWGDGCDVEYRPLYAVPVQQGDGWVLVPRHPTSEQKAAGSIIVDSYDLAHECYNQMIAAAPTPEKGVKQ